MDDSGSISYDRLYTNITSDNSKLDINTGKYQAKTQGIYTVTWSATLQNGQLDLYLFKDGVKQADTRFESRQNGMDFFDMGSRTTVSIPVIIGIIIIVIIIDTDAMS